MAMAFDLGRTKCVCVYIHRDRGGYGRADGGASPASVCRADDHYFCALATNTSPTVVTGFLRVLFGKRGKGTALQLTSTTLYNYYPLHYSSL